MTLTQAELRKKMEPLFPTLTWAGESCSGDSWSGGSPEPAKPVRLDQFLERIQKEFPKVSHKDLYISFSTYQLAVTHSTQQSRKKAAALAKRNCRTMFTVTGTWKVQDALRAHAAQQSRLTKEHVNPAEIAGNILAEELRAVSKKTVFEHTKHSDTGTERLHRSHDHNETHIEVRVSSKAYDKLRAIAFERGLGKSDVVIPLLLQGIKKLSEKQKTVA